MSTMPLGAIEPMTSEPLAVTSVAGPSVPKTQPLWRFALVGLGPLTAMGVFALVVAFAQRFS
jgi:hypothetical protein